MALAAWMNSHHLCPNSVEALAGTFRSDPFDTVVFDDFLQKEPLEGLRALFERDGHWTERYVLKGDPLAMPEGSRQDWSRAREEERFSSQLALEGPRPGHEMSPGLLNHLHLVRTARSAAFLDLLTRITGQALAGLEGCQARVMLPGHQMEPHTDFGNGRALCAVLYLHRSWHVSLKGRFLQYDGTGTTRAVDPLPNRMVLFATSGHLKHAVEPMVGEASDWRRYTYSIWFRSADVGNHELALTLFRTTDLDSRPTIDRPGIRRATLRLETR